LFYLLKALGYVDSSFRKDKEVVIVAISNSVESATFVDSTLRNDKDVLAALIKQKRIEYEM